ncbi:MAG: lecithin retinol acyltransferase family protein [Thermoguttaceae bacterium]|nr:lecithin retinol acyltransferase family protein [Thermoguttaceae bacterium]MDW8037711.1 lecithin retinol acyltransferase family protein [Thermoguttaceae bacterium]
MKNTNKGNDLQKGDHVFVSYGVYTHHGIYIGDGQVVHLTKEKGQVVQSSLKEFCDGRPLMVVDYEHSDDPSTVVSRAVSRIGQKEYNLFAGNCEHFATWCKTGQAKSLQVESLVHRAISAGAKRVAIKVASKLGVRGIRDVATPWMLVADLAQLGTETISRSAGDMPEEAQAAGRLVGLGSSAAIGWMVGGPMGALVGGGLWLLGEVAAAFFSGLFSSPEPQKVHAAPVKAR